MPVVGEEVRIDGSLVVDPASLAAGANQAFTVTVTGAAVGDFAEASFSIGHVDVDWTAQVTSANTATAFQWNRGVGAVDLASGTLRVRVRKV